MILDDSNDETSKIIDEKTAVNLSNIRIMRREKRTGYKAGALQYGLQETDADYIAIFDADFIPDKEYLNQVIPLMENDTQIGLVQTRWGHINQDFNKLSSAWDAWDED